MPIPAQLVELRSRLEAAGMIVVEEPDRLTIRLPFFCSVRVYSDGQRLRFESYFGIAARDRSTMLKLFGLGLLSVASVKFGFQYAGLTAFLAIIAGIYDSIRWQLTEHAITRVSMIATLANLQTDAPHLIATGTSQLLRSGANPSAVPADRVHVRERRDD